MSDLIDRSDPKRSKKKGSIDLTDSELHRCRSHELAEKSAQVGGLLDRRRSRSAPSSTVTTSKAMPRPASRGGPAWRRVSGSTFWSSPSSRRSRRSIGWTEFFICCRSGPGGQCRPKRLVDDGVVHGPLLRSSTANARFPFPALTRRLCTHRLGRSRRRRADRPGQTVEAPACSPRRVACLSRCVCKPERVRARAVSRRAA